MFSAGDLNFTSLRLVSSKEADDNMTRRDARKRERQRHKIVTKHVYFRGGAPVTVASIGSGTTKCEV